MARFNEILVGRYNRFAQKLLQIKGDAPVPQLAGDIQLSMPLYSGAENRYLESWDRYGVGVLVAAQVGINSGARLRNPLGANLVIVVERIVVSEPAGDAILLEMIPPATAGDLATATNGF